MNQDGWMLLLLNILCSECALHILLSWHMRCIILYHTLLLPGVLLAPGQIKHHPLFPYG
jgi:hypothetical protein